MLVVAKLGASTILLLPAMVLARTVTLRRGGITAMKFGETDKTDFFIPPFVLFYLYLIFANAFAWPAPVHIHLFSAQWPAWAGVLCCAIGMRLWHGAWRRWAGTFASASIRIGPTS